MAEESMPLGYRDWFDYRCRIRLFRIVRRAPAKAGRAVADLVLCIECGSAWIWIRSRDRVVMAKGQLAKSTCIHCAGGENGTYELHWPDAYRHMPVLWDRIRAGSKGRTI